MNNNWFKKEKPFATIIGMGGGATSLINSAGGNVGAGIDASGGMIGEYVDAAGDAYKTHVFTSSGRLTVNLSLIHI